MCAEKIENEGQALAIVSLICGIVSICTFGCFIIPEILGIYIRVSREKARCYERIGKSRSNLQLRIHNYCGFSIYSEHEPLRVWYEIFINNKRGFSILYWGRYRELLFREGCKYASQYYVNFEVNTRYSYIEWCNVPPYHIDVILAGEKDFLEAELEYPLIYSPKMLLEYMSLS